MSTCQTSVPPFPGSIASSAETGALSRDTPTRAEAMPIARERLTLAGAGALIEGLVESATSFGGAPAAWFTTASDPSTRRPSTRWW